MPLTIYDIAEKANVSIATVSRAFNNHPRVSAKTKERIFKIAESHHYQPNVSARNLARQNSFVVSAVVPMVTNYFFMEVLQGLQDKLAESNFDLMVYSVLTPEQATEQLERALQRGRSEGVLLFSTWINDQQAEQIQRKRVPTILVDSFHPQFDSITVDNEKGSFMATQHLIQEGFGKIGLVTANRISTPARERRKGYEKALEHHGMVVKPEMIAESQDEKMHGFSEEEGYIGMMRLLAQTEGNLDAAVVTSDVQALGCLRALKEKGLHASQDIALIGYDDVKLASYAGLSTMRQPMYDMGCYAVDMLFERLDQADELPKHKVFEPELVIRESTKGIEK